jgi:hypothetical protein
MRTYSPSGTIPIAGAVITVLSGLVAALVAGFLYAYLFRWAFIWFLRILLTSGFALLLGGTIDLVARRTKIRSPLFVTAVAVVTTLAGLWIYWGATIWAREGAGRGLAAWSPAELVAYGQHLFANGSWRFKGWQVTGLPLVGFWIAEALWVLYLSLGMARSEVYRPFCESCLAWTESSDGLMRLRATGQEPAWREVLEGELPALAEFPPADDTDAELVRLDLASCPKCEQSNFLTLVAVKCKTNSKGKVSTTETTLVKSGEVSDVHAEFLRQFAAQAEASAEAAADAEDDNEIDDSEEDDSRWNRADA